MKTQPTTASLFDDPEEVSSRILSDDFDAADGDPTETYAGLAAHVRAEEGSW